MSLKNNCVGLGSFKFIDNKLAKNKKNKKLLTNLGRSAKKGKKIASTIYNISGEEKIMDINTLTFGMGTPTNKGRSQAEPVNLRTHNDIKEAQPASTSETVTITETTNRLRQLSQGAMQQPEVNSARVAQIRSALADGSYKVKPDIIAAKLMSFETALRR